jgi:hypothetical protein
MSFNSEEIDIVCKCKSMTLDQQEDMNTFIECIMHSSRGLDSLKITVNEYEKNL